MSEKASLQLEVGSDDHLFEWMMSRYQETMRVKSFQGPAVSLVSVLQRDLPVASRLLVLRAVHDNEPIAGICLAYHGAAATYLIGWNGQNGRKLKANQYLLWQAIAHLKRSGFNGFDLGGIDDEDTSGIASFKLGLGGERYELVGEYWKW